MSETTTREQLLVSELSSMKKLARRMSGIFMLFAATVVIFGILVGLLLAMYLNH